MSIGIYDVDLSIHDLTRRSTALEHIETMGKGDLSIHDLTRRSTRKTRNRLQVFQLSIHDLTRRSTTPQMGHFCSLSPFNSRPHKEVDEIW